MHLRVSESEDSAGSWVCLVTLCFDLLKWLKGNEKWLNVHSSHHKATGFWFPCGRLFILPERHNQKCTAVLVMFFLLNEIWYIGLKTWAITIYSHVGNCWTPFEENCVLITAKSWSQFCYRGLFITAHHLFEWWLGRHAGCSFVLSWRAKRAEWHPREQIPFLVWLLSYWLLWSHVLSISERCGMCKCIAENTDLTFIY